MGGAQAVCLAVIVRDESHVIRRMLASVKPFISHWAVVDTGSKDGTQQIIREELKALPGRLIEREWHDFATARNQAFELGRSVLASDKKLDSGYLLTVDADETLVAAEDFQLPELKADSYALAFKLDDTDQVWGRRVLFRASKPWRWIGIIHEHPELEGSSSTDTRGIVGLTAHSRSDGARSQLGKVEKAKRDLKVLKRAVRLEPDNPRHYFYLAQTYTAARKIGKAIATYEKRARMGGFDEEVYHSLFQIACLKEFRGDPLDEVRVAYLKSYEARPTRAEPLFALAVLHNDHEMPATAELYARAACGKARPPDALIVTESVYAWRCADELAGALARQGKNDEAVKIVHRLLECKNLPDVERPRLQGYLAEVAANETSDDSEAA